MSKKVIHVRLFWMPMKDIFLLCVDFDFNVLIGKMLVSFYEATVFCDLRRLNNTFRFLISLFSNAWTA